MEDNIRNFDPEHIVRCAEDLAAMRTIIRTLGVGVHDSHISNTLSEFSSILSDECDKLWSDIVNQIYLAYSDKSKEE